MSKLTLFVIILVCVQNIHGGVVPEQDSDSNESCDNDVTNEPITMPPMPTMEPFSMPTMKPFSMPTMKPFSMPTMKPFSMPTMKPFSMPTMKPFTMPTMKPFSMPTMKPIKPISIKDIKNLKPDKGGTVHGESHSESHSMKMVNGKIVEDVSAALDVVNDDGVVKESQEQSGS